MSDPQVVIARLREVLAGKDEQLAGQEVLLAAQRERLETQGALMQTQKEEIQTQGEQIATQAELIKRLESEVAELGRRLGMDSQNSSTPPSKDSIAAKAKKRANRSSRERSGERKPGGQPGRKGSGLAPTADPDRTERVEPPRECRDCGADLADAGELGDGWAQLWDVTPAVLTKAHYLLPRRRCGCGATTTAGPPFGRAGTVSYGPNLNAAAVLLASEGNVPVERTAALVGALFGVEVSTGFVARAKERLSEALDAAGFDAAMRSALRAEEVLCGDESPIHALGNDVDQATGQEVAGTPHALTLRTPDARLIWYAGLPSRSKSSIASLGVLDGWHGYLVRDDYAGWHQFDPALAGVQQCCAHLIRHCKGVAELHPQWQHWATRVVTVLREAAQAVQTAQAAGACELDRDLLAGLRGRYNTAVDWGITTNRHRDWHTGTHPGYTLARRLKDKAEQVWTFTTNFKIPWTNNPSEQALRNPKRHQAVSGYWHSTDTLRDDLRVRSYLTSARGHGLRAITAIHRALAGNPWLPIITA
ncbi:MAG: IS66 family transposase [Nocardioidaceae bacterium]